ncbi:MAG: LacI family DNA-binding transcriptional regulator, partial [Litoreibacter sp.]|nr:LacI family DNA-binding transcriptional regulator [Litoreibacter sp.]
MARRPTIKDIAREAGVSVATVNRVLAGNVPVREETGRRVSEAAHRIGYHGTNLIEQRLRPDLPRVRFGFVIQKERQGFYEMLADALEVAVKQLQHVNGDIEVVFSPSQSPKEASNALLEMAENCDVIGSTAVNHHQINDTVRALSERGIPTVAMLSDFAQGERINYIGLKNLKVGRGA